MRDALTFETRLADALGRYAELAPVMDDHAIAQQAIKAGGSARRMGWLTSLVGPRRLRVAYLLIILALLLAAILVAVAGGTFRNQWFPSVGRNGAIAFTLQGNNHEAPGIHVMNSDGTGDHTINVDRCPTYSNDGSVLASLSYEDSTYLVLWGPDGKPAQRVLLVDGPQTTAVPYGLSPDGTRVAWFKPAVPDATGSPSPDSDPAGSSSDELWVAPVAGGPGMRILPGSSIRNESHGSPIWSPDGSRIAFASYVADAATGERHRWAIDVVAANGAGLRRLTTRSATVDDGMAWSPDGRFLTYLGLPDGPSTPSPATEGTPSVAPARDVFVIAADGTGDRNLTSTPAFESQPAWSPDGARLAYATSADGEAHRVTTIHMNGPTPVGQPAIGPESAWFVWSPDGTQLLWLEVTSIDTEVYRSTLHVSDRDFRQGPTTLQAVDGLIVCPASWQRLEP